MNTRRGLLGRAVGALMARRGTADDRLIDPMARPAQRTDERLGAPSTPAVARKVEDLARYAQTATGTVTVVGGGGPAGTPGVPGEAPARPEFYARDYASIQQALDAANAAGGGRVVLDAGTFDVPGLLFDSEVWLDGQGQEATVLRLQAGLNAPVLQSRSFATLTGTNAAAGEHEFTISNLTVDGNRANCPGSTGHGIRIYGYGYRLLNVAIRYCNADGLHSEWSDAATVGGANEMEAYLLNLKIHECTGTGFVWKGPHDSTAANVISYGNGGNGFHFLGVGGGATMLANSHAYGADQDYAYVVDAAGTKLISPLGEAGDLGCILIRATGCDVVGGMFNGHDPAVHTPNIGVVLGQAAGAAAYVCRVHARVHDCPDGAVVYANDGGGNRVDLLVQQSGGTMESGTRHATTEAVSVPSGGVAGGVRQEVVPYRLAVTNANAAVWGNAGGTSYLNANVGAGGATWQFINGADAEWYSGNFTGLVASVDGATGAALFGSLALTTDLPVSEGGTGAGTAAGARTNLGLVIGTDVQAFSAILADLAGLTQAADRLPYFDTATTAALAVLTAAGRALLDDADAAAQRTTLGLVIGTNVQAFDADLSALAGIAANGLLARTGAGTAAARTLTGGTGITVTNGDGAAGNPTLALDVGQVFHHENHSTGSATNTSTATYVDLLSSSFVLPTGTWDVQMAWGMNGWHSASATVQARSELGGTAGDVFGSFAAADVRRYLGFSQARTGLSGTVTYKVQFKSDTAGTSTGHQPHVFVVCRRTA